MKTNTKTKALIVLGIAVALIGALLIRGHREARMEAYALEHNCEWSYSYYINEEPVCK